MPPLSQKEIQNRLTRLRNLERLHEVQVKRNRFLEEQVRLLTQVNQEHAKTIQTLLLRIEELERMIFGRKKKKNREEDEKTKKDDDGNDTDFPPQTPVSRDPESYHRPLPKEIEITDEKHHTLDACPECKIPLEKKTLHEFYEEDIILPTEENPLKKVIRHTIEKGWCPTCRKWFSSAPIPSTKVVLGKNVRLYLCYLSILIRLSFESIRNLLSTTYRFEISDGEIAKILEQEADALRPEYEALKDRIRSQSAVHYDETSWKVQREELGNYAWAMLGAETPDVVFDCGKSRGKGVAEDLKGDGAHFGITDDYGVYRTLFGEGKHQLCWAHPHRKLRELTETESLDTETKTLCMNTHESFALLYHDLRIVLAQPFEREKREKWHRNFLERLDMITAPHEYDPKKLRTIKESLCKRREAYFVCLLHKGIPADNNKAERAIRPLVLKRRNSFGSKTQKGAETTSILASILYSLFRRKPANFFGELRRLKEV